MNPMNFQILAEFLKKESGLIVGEDKLYLLESRLMPVARSEGLKTLDDVAQAVRARASGDFATKVVEAMTTNESFFFRDVKPFDQFRDYVLPRLLEARAAERSIRIWSAACSSGQEAYSLAMLLREADAKLAGWRIDIVGTDISLDIVQKAKKGVYTQFEVQRGLPIQLLVKYFKQDGDRWAISDELKRMVEFRTFNLLRDPCGLGKFDVVYCRNVLIYFDQATKGQVLERVHSVTAPDGYLFLGGAETVLGISDKFKNIPGERSVYAPAGSAALRAAG